LPEAGETLTPCGKKFEPSKLIIKGIALFVLTQATMRALQRLFAQTLGFARPLTMMAAKHYDPLPIPLMLMVDY
jgi:hypothetical protein